MIWIQMKDCEPRLEQVYLVFSPLRGYETAMWENKPSLRNGWDGVTHWAQFPFLKTPPSQDNCHPKG
jgi:hypothetical protein